MSDFWGKAPLKGLEASPPAQTISAPWWMIIGQGVLAAAASSSLWLNSWSARVAMWGVAVLAALVGVTYRYIVRKNSLKPEFRGMSTSTAVSLLFWSVFIVNLVAIILTSYRASLVFPE